MKRKILALAWPAICEMMLYMLLDFVDVAFVGRLGAQALAGVGLGAQIYFSGLFMFSALAAGATALIARSIGAKEYARAGEVARQSLALAFVVGIVISLAAVFFAENLISLFRIEPAVRMIATDYLRTTGCAATFGLVLFISNGIFRGAGMTKIPMLVAVLTNAINIGGDYVLIFGKLGFPAMGAQGAAIATALAQVAGCFTILFLLNFGLTPLRFRLCDLFRRREGSYLQKIVSLSLPAGCEEVLMSLGRIIGSYMLVGLGTMSFAAHQVALTAESLSYMPGYGFAVATTTLVGQALGAQNASKARQHAWEAARLAIFVMGGISLLFLLFPTGIVRIFARDPGVLVQSAVCLRIAAIEQPGIALDMVLAGALRGAGDTRTPMLITVFSTWFLRIPLIYLAINVFSCGLPVIWGIAVFDWSVRALLVALVFQRGRWQQIRLFNN